MYKAPQQLVLTLDALIPSTNATQWHKDLITSLVSTYVVTDTATKKTGPGISRKYYEYKRNIENGITSASTESTIKINDTLKIG
jgi:hypothetical protein